MREEYKVFDKGFNKVLDLIESAKGQGAEGYCNFVNILPDEVLEKLETCEEFEIENQFYIASLCNTGNTLHFDFARRYNYLRVQLKVHRIFQEEIENNDSIELFELVLKNTPTGVKKGENAFEYRWNINLVLEGFDYYLKTLTTIDDKSNRHKKIVDKIYVSKVPVTYDEIQTSLETEDEYKPDLEIEFDSGYDL